MKKKLCIITLGLCMVLSMTGCMNSTDTGQSGMSITETDSKETVIKKEKKNAESTRIVSVDDVDDYVAIAQYKGIELDSISKDVTDEMVETRILEILDEASTETMGSKATVQEGDIVTVSYVGTIDGKSFEGGTVTYYDWIVGSGEMFPAFEEGVLGMKRGETKEILCTFPEDYHSEILSGKEVSFKVNIQAIRRTPTLDDDWVAGNSDVKTVDEYKEVVRSELEAEIDTIVENQLKNIAWEKLVTNSEMLEYPEKDIETAKALFHAQMNGYAESYGMELEEFVKSQGLTMEEYEEQCQLYAERKVKQNLIVQGIIDEEGILLDDEESLAIQNQMMQDYGAENIAELIDMYSQVQIDESIALLRVEDFIYENAVIVEPVVAAAESTEVQDSSEVQEDEAVQESTEAQESITVKDENSDVTAKGNADENTEETENSEASDESAKGETEEITEKTTEE